MKLYGIRLHSGWVSEDFKVANEKLKMYGLKCKKQAVSKRKERPPRVIQTVSKEVYCD